MRTSAGVLVSMAVVLAVAGCGQPHDEDVRGVARLFYDAYKGERGDLACRLLAPETRSEQARR